MSARLTDEDRAFIRAILDHPDELTTWLAYADWLDDRGDPRAEYLRLRARRQELATLDPQVEVIDTRLGVLEVELDPKWLLAFTDALVRNCSRVQPGDVCPAKTWAMLSPTDEPDLRLCHECNKPVFHCTTAEEARDFLSCGQAVVLSPQIPPEHLTILAPFLPTDDLEDEFEDSALDDDF